MISGPRIVIIGNSGSGKSTLARLLESGIGGENIDLDRVHWLDQVGIKRDEAEAKAMVAAMAGKPRWIIEGVYGWLAEAALFRATTLIWLDMPWSICRESLAQRGPHGAGRRPNSTANFSHGRSSIGSVEPLPPMMVTSVCSIVS